MTGSGRFHPFRLLISLAAVCCALFCAAPAPASLTRLTPSNVAAHFDRIRATGTLVIQKGDDSPFIFNEARARQAFLPASTFKIFNSLVALDAGVIGVDDRVAWDGVQRSVPAWNQDQSMREAFQRSTVWFYQELARRIGPVRMRAALRREQYGNASIGGGIDQFWLTGGLRISAVQQIDFLRRLQRKQTGFSNASMAIVEALLVLEACDHYILRGKTGWAPGADRQLGWVVGWVERAGDVYTYALNLESPDSQFPMIEARQSVLRGILRDGGLIDATCR